MIAIQPHSETAKAMIVADVDYLGPRLDAADRAGQKGAHIDEKLVSRVEPGTYRLLGDMLRIGDVTAPPRVEGEEQVAALLTEHADGPE